MVGSPVTCGLRGGGDISADSTRLLHTGDGWWALNLARATRPPGVSWFTGSVSMPEANSGK
jgi:hypothetical protein